MITCRSLRWVGRQHSPLTDVSMLRHARMAAMTGRAAAFGMVAGRRLWAVPVQAGKVCNHRASPNRHLSSIPRNGYGPVNMQCAARATARRDPLVDGKLEHQLMTAFEKIHPSFPSAVQGPQWADSDKCCAMDISTPRAGSRHSLREHLCL
jgi:hypothetical protein